MNIPGGTALLTGAGPAAIAIVRLTGPGVQEFVARHLRWAQPATRPLPAPGQVRRATLVDEDGAPLDDVLVAVHATGPHADLRVHLHGNPVLVQRCRELAAACDLVEYPPRHAAADGLGPPGSSGPPLWPGQDLLAAAVAAELPHVLTFRGVLWVLDQERRLRAVLQECVRSLAADGPVAVPSVRARLTAIAARTGDVTRFTQSLRVALVGPPNAGKSTLLNALADRPIALVSPHPGTTRDWLEVDTEWDGYPLTWIDTAGLRATDDAMEAAGVERTRRALASAAATVIVLDATDPGAAAEFIRTYSALRPAVVALNKSDLGPATVGPQALPAGWRPVAIETSARTGAGLSELRQRVLAAVGCLAPEPLDPAPIGSEVSATLRSAAVEVGPKTISEIILRLIRLADDPGR